MLTRATSAKITSIILHAPVGFVEAHIYHMIALKRGRGNGPMSSAWTSWMPGAFPGPSPAQWRAWMPRRAMKGVCKGGKACGGNKGNGWRQMSWNNVLELQSIGPFSSRPPRS